MHSGQSQHISGKIRGQCRLYGKSALIKIKQVVTSDGGNNDVRRNAHQEEQDPVNVLAYIQRYGGDEDFVPPNPADEPSTGMPGTPDKLATMARRVELGQQLWHEEDRTDFE